MGRSTAVLALGLLALHASAPGLAVAGAAPLQCHLEDARSAVPDHSLLQHRRVIASASQAGLSSPLQRKQGQTLKITVFNQYHLPLLKEGMGAWLGDPKFTEGLRVFCSDGKSFDWCKSSVAAPGQCLRTKATLGGADNEEGDYFRHIWLKWSLIQQSLQQEGVEGLYWLDADVAVFSEFKDCADTRGVDFMYQEEKPGNASTVNGGQLWFRQCGRVSEFLGEVLKHASDRDTGDLDQMWAQRAMVKISGLRTRALPHDRFQSHCWNYLHPVTPLACTYHVCCEGNVTGKLAAMRTAREQYKAAVSAV